MGFADASKAAKRCSARLPNEMVGAAATISRLTYTLAAFIYLNSIWYGGNKYDFCKQLWLLKPIRRDLFTSTCARVYYGTARRLHIINLCGMIRRNVVWGGKVLIKGSVPRAPGDTHSHMKAQPAKAFLFIFQNWPHLFVTTFTLQARKAITIHTTHSHTTGFCLYANARFFYTKSHANTQKSCLLPVSQLTQVTKQQFRRPRQWER
jgi:hypothetical protein